MSAIQVTRRRAVLAVAALLASAAIGPVAIAATTDIAGDTAARSVRALGLPEVEIVVGPEGLEAPAALPAGHVLFTLVPEGPNLAGLTLLQPPAGMPESEIVANIPAAISEDVALPGWVYAGGVEAMEPGEPESFVVDLQPGEYRLAAAWRDAEAMDAAPSISSAVLTVARPASGPEATAAAREGAPEAAVRLEMTDDLAYLVAPSPLPAGPQVWEIANTGTLQAHHAVMMRVPDGTTAEQIVEEAGAMMTGAAPSPDGVMAQAAPAGYAGMQTGGITTWAEFDLEPGTYAVICFIADPATGHPHVMEGMVSVFTVG